MRIFHFVLALFALITFSNASKAAIVYEIAFDQAEYNVAPGGSADVRVLFREIRDAGDVVSVPKLAVGGADGLAAGGFVFNYGGGDNEATFQSFTLNSAADRFDPAFSAPVEDNRVTKRFEVIPLARNFNDGIELISFSDVAGRDIFEIELGRFSLQNVGSISSVTQLNLAASGIPFSILFNDSSEPSSGSVTFGSATFGAVTAVPEPASFVVLGGLIAGFALRNRKRISALTASPSAS